jgi:two-component system sensor histidine kinase PilS (NtrC family)
MPISNSNQSAELSATTAQKLQNLIIGRLVVSFLLLVSAWIWKSGHLPLSFDNFPQELFFFFLISVGLTIVYFFILRMSSGYLWQTRTQLFIDLMLITWLVWQTGDINSPYVALYIVIISITSLFLSPKETLAFAILSTLLYSAVSFATLFGFMPSATMLIGNLRSIQTAGFQIIAFLVVTLLSMKLAERWSSASELKATVKNLANLKALHERIVQSIRSGLITTDLKGIIYTFNPAAEEITGYKAEEVKGKNIKELMGDIEQAIELSLAGSVGNEQLPRFQTDILTPEGFAVHIGYNIAPLYLEDGEISGLIITFQDLTEIYAMEESFRRKERLAAVGRIAAGIAHEIRNPLGAIRGAIQVLQMNLPKDESQSALMEIILRESDRLNRIITDFLAYARPRISNLSETNICEIVNDTFTLLRHSPEVTGNHTFKVISSDEKIHVLADPIQLKQIFWNLAQNSIKATPNGGEIVVSINKLASQRIQIVFQDNGCGMPPEQVERLFEPFSKSTTGGTGLGLSIVYQIVKDHGGTINVRSKQGQGTTVVIEFPPISQASKIIGKNRTIETEEIASAKVTSSEK